MSDSGVAEFASRLAFRSALSADPATFQDVDVVVTHGYAAPGDGSGAIYKRCGTLPNWWNAEVDDLRGWQLRDVTATFDSVNTLFTATEPGGEARAVLVPSGEHTLTFKAKQTGSGPIDLLIGMEIHNIQWSSTFDVYEVDLSSFAGLWIGFRIGRASTGLFVRDFTVTPGSMEANDPIWEMDQQQQHIFMLAEREPRLGQCGLVGGPLGAHPIESEWKYLQRALTYNKAIWGGGRVLVEPDRRYRSANHIRMFDDQSLCSETHPGYRHRYDTAPTNPMRAHGISLDSGCNIIPKNNCIIERLMLIRSSFTRVNNLLDALNYQKNLADGGDCIVVDNVRSVRSIDNGFYGFDRCHYGTNNPANFLIYRPFGDAGTIARLENAGSECKVIDYNFGPPNDGVEIPLFKRKVTALSNADGATVLTLADSHGVLFTGTNITCDGLPWAPILPTPNSRPFQRVEVIDDTHIRLSNVAWNEAYLTADLADATISYCELQDVCIAQLSPSGGFLRVDLEVAVPVLGVDHWCSIDLDGQPGQGWYQIKQVLSGGSGFVVDTPWETEYANTVLTYAALVILPHEKNQTRVELNEAPGTEVSGDAKGGNALSINCPNIKARISHEGGRQGELQRVKPGSFVIYLDRGTRRVSIESSAAKSTDRGIVINTNEEVIIIATEVTDAGSSAFHCVRGNAVVVCGGRQLQGRGRGRIRVESSFGNLDFIGNEFSDDDVVAASPATKAKVRFHNVRDPANPAYTRSVGPWRHRTFDTATGLGVDRLQIDESGRVLAFPAADATGDEIITASWVLPRVPAIGTHLWNGSTSGGSAALVPVGEPLGIAAGATAMSFDLYVIARRTNIETREAAEWVIPGLMLNAGNTANSAALTGGGEDLAPTRYRFGASTWRLSLELNAENEVVLTGTTPAGVNGDWTAKAAVMLKLEPPASY